MNARYGQGIEERLVSLVFLENPLEIVEFLLQMGCQAELQSDGTINNYNPYTDMRGGLLWETTDYSTRASMLGLMLAGIFWTNAFPNLLEKVNKEWRARKKRQ